MYQLNDSITITAAGTVGGGEISVTGQYSLGTYIQNPDAAATDACFAKTLFTLAKASLDYWISTQD